MRELIFSDEHARRRLESILHPLIEARVIEQIRRFATLYCIVVVPLLTESDSYAWVDLVLVVDAPEEEQVRRVMKRDGIDRAHAMSILKAQSSRAQRLAQADFILSNTTDLDGLRDQVSAMHERFQELAKSHRGGHTRVPDSAPMAS
jgi:dephospho-CoA kinase